MNYKEKKRSMFFWSAVDFYVLYGDRRNYHSGHRAVQERRK